MSFLYHDVKYFVPFYKDEEFWVKPKYYNTAAGKNNNEPTSSTSLLDILSDMFRRQLLNASHGGEITKAYWRSVIEEEERVSALLIFSDKVYRKYPTLQKPSKHDTPSFQTISCADTVVPSGLSGHFLKQLDIAEGDDNHESLLKGVRLKIRISRQHIHARSIVIPYQPSIILEDKNIMAVNKPFGVPSMGERNDLGSNEWNSILTWCRLSSSKEDHDEENNNSKAATAAAAAAGKYCDLINRLDLDVSGLVLLGKSGAYRKKRGFAGLSGVGSAKTVKVYLAIIPRQEHGIRIMTPRLAFNTKTSRAVIKTIKSKNGDDKSSKEEESQQLVCKTSIYPLLDICDQRYSLAAISLEESGQRHQIRFHLSLIDATIANDELYLDSSRNDKEYQRTGVRPPNISHEEESSSQHVEKTTKVPVDDAACLKSSSSSIVHTEKISEVDCAAFLREYVFINGVAGFEEIFTSNEDKDCKRALIERTLYPCSDSTLFVDLLKKNFEFCGHCGKCQKLLMSSHDTPNGHTKEDDPIRLSHGIFLHSWRYFRPTNEHFLLEAPLPGEQGIGSSGKNQQQVVLVEERSNVWWPVRTKRETPN